MSDGLGCQAPKPEFDFSEPTWQKERTDFTKLSSDFAYTLWHRQNEQAGIPGVQARGNEFKGTKMAKGERRDSTMVQRMETKENELRN